MRLWQNQARGWKWAKILFAAQIPVLTVPGLSYEYYAGIAIKLLGGEVDSYFNLGLGANANFYLGTSITGLLYGVNVFALLAFLYLFRRRLADKRPDTIAPLYCGVSSVRAVGTVA